MTKGEIEMTFKVIKQEWTPDMDCEHALCSTLHKPYHKRSVELRQGWYCDKPVAPRIEWLIEDTATGEPLLIDGVLSYDLKRDAVKALKYYISRNVAPTVA